MPEASGPVALVVDDVEAMTATVGSFLERRIPGLRVVTKTRTRDALAWLETAPRVDLILSDNHIDEMEGVEFLARCRTLAPRATRALMTAYFDIPADRLAGAAPHALVRKPWEWSELALFAHDMMLLAPEESARLEREGPLSYPREAAASFRAAPPPAPARAAAPRERAPPASAEDPTIPRAPKARSTAEACPRCEALLSDEDEARRIAALLQARPGVARAFVALQAARARPAGAASASNAGGPAR